MGESPSVLVRGTLRPAEDRPIGWTRMVVHIADEHAAQAPLSSGLGIGATVARNTAWFAVGSILQKFISFVYFTVIAMAFGDAETGRYFFAFAFTALFAVATDWGIAPVLTREIAKDRARGIALIVPALAFKCACAIAVAGIITVLARIFGYDASGRAMIALATLVMVLDSFHLGCYALLRGLQRISYEAIGLVAGQLALTVSGIGIFVAVAGLHYDAAASPVLAVARPMNLLWLLVPYLAASAVNLGIALTGCVRERVFVGVRRPPTSAVWRDLLRMATPFAIAGGLARIYTYIDTFLIRSLLGAGAIAVVGVYSIAFKIAFAFQFIPLAFMGALYPAMSALAVRNRAQLPELFTQALRVLWIIALPLATGIALLAHRLIPLFYGASSVASVLPLVFLLAALPFVFANFPCGNLLNACDRQAVNTKLLAGATLVNVIANVLLIPQYGAAGAAASALIASVVLFAANLVAVSRTATFRLRAVIGPFLRAAVACAAMAAALTGAGGALALPAAIVLGAFVYVAALIAVRGVRWADVVVLRGLLASRV